jgi:hypothetical protein
VRLKRVMFRLQVLASTLTLRVVLAADGMAMNRMRHPREAPAASDVAVVIPPERAEHREYGADQSDLADVAAKPGPEPVAATRVVLLGAGRARAFGEGMPEPAADELADDDEGSDYTENARHHEQELLHAAHSSAGTGQIKATTPPRPARPKSLREGRIGGV